jgi:transportin-3
MLHVIRSFGEELPESCKSSCQEAWSIFDSFIDKYGSNYDLAERTNRVLRHGITLFDKTSRTIATPALKRLSSSFEATGYPSYLWIAGKLIGTFGDDEDAAIRAAFKDVYERSTNRVVETLQTTAAHDIPDGL